MSEENLPQDGELPDQVMTDDDPPDRGISNKHHDDLIKVEPVDNLSNVELEQLPDCVISKSDLDGMGHSDLYDMSDLLMNGAVDSVAMMDMPLFNEVDSLMNIKHEDHLNDKVIYLPMSHPLDTHNNIKISMPDNTLQSPDASLMVTDNNAATGALLYMAPEGGSDVPLIANVTVPQVVFKPDITNALNNEQSTQNNNPTTSSSSSSSSSTPFKPVMIKNLMVRNSTDILANSLRVNGSGQGQASALEHMLVSDTGTTTVTLNPCKDMSGHLVSLEPAGRVGGRRGARRASDGQLLSSDSSLDCIHGGQLKHSASTDGSLAHLGGKDDSSLPAELEVEASLSADGEIDRFVICSDFTMKCVLCSFSTDSYSAFKSHIICSHPCWRITKKLSKNRLLVEKSVKASTSFNLNLDPSNLKIRSTNGSKEEDPYLSKISRKIDRNPRKRQLFERNKRLFKCTLCLRLFVFEGSVVNHVTEHHKESRPYDYIHISNDHGHNFGPIYRCQQQNCYFSCESEKELERHNVDRHTQVIYRCQLCGYTADSAAAVHGHGIRMHQQQLTCFDQV